MSKAHSALYLPHSLSPPKVTSPINYLLSDTTISKATYNKTRADRMITKAKIKESTLAEQREVRLIAQKCRKVQEDWDKCVKQEISRISQKKKQCELAAVKIQKIVRGFLVRIKIDSILLSQRESRSTEIIKELRKQTDFCMLTLGANTVPAVRSIQAAYRRYIFKKKLEVMRLCYQQWLKEREEIICDYLRQVFIGFNCRLKRAYLIFLEYRVKRLEEIKRNLAILTVKKIWRAKKLSFKILKEKFIRIKRRKAAMQNKEAYQKYLSTMGGPAKKDNKPETGSSRDLQEGNLNEEKGENNENHEEEDKEFKEAQRIKEIIEKKIREKVNMSKMAYGIIENNTKVVMPMMQEKALAESLDNDALQSKLLHLTASVFAKGQRLDRNKMPNISRNLQISSPRPVSQRRHSLNFNIPPLLIISPAETTRPEHSEISIKPIIDAHFLSTTISSENKQQPQIISEWEQREIERNARRRQHTKRTTHYNHAEIAGSENGEKRTTKEFKPIERKNHWIPVARRFASYIPGIDNSFYSPQKWSPLPLNRRILTTAIPKPNQSRPTNTALSPLAYSPNELNFINLSAQSKKRQFIKDPLHSFSPSTQEHSVELNPFN